MLDCSTSIEFLTVQPGVGDQRSGFGQSFDFEREDQIHGQLHGLSRAVRSQQKKLFAHGFEQGLGAVEHFLLARRS